MSPEAPTEEIALLFAVVTFLPGEGAGSCDGASQVALGSSRGQLKTGFESEDKV